MLRSSWPLAEERLWPLGESQRAVPLGLWPKSLYDLLDATLHERTHLRGTFAYNTPERHLPLIFYPLFWLRCGQNARGVLAPINLNAPVWGLN